MGDAKFKLEDILNKQKAQPQILDLTNVKIESEEDFKNVIEKIPDYKIKPERPEETAEQIEALAESMKRYKELRRKQKEYRRGLGHSVVVVSQATAGGVTSNAISIDSDHVNGENGDHSSKDDKAVANGTNKMEDTYGDMHSKRGITWKGIILRRRDKIKELSIGVEVSKAYAIGKNLEQYQKENDPAKNATTILETTLSQLRRKNLDDIKKSKKRSRVKRRRFRMTCPDGQDYVSFPEERRNSQGVLLDSLPRGPSQLGSRAGGQSRGGNQNSSISTELPYEFADPCPESMRAVNISDLSSVNINWKMLTLARPDNKTDEEIFSKLVQLDKLRLATVHAEEDAALARGGKDPFIVVKAPSASKGGVAETSIKVCTECSEEFCSGTCKNFQYDSYQRLIIEEKEKDGPGGSGVSGLNADKLGGVGMDKQKSGKDKGKGSTLGKRQGKPGKKDKKKNGKKDILAGMPI